MSREDFIEAGARLYLEKYGFDSYRRAYDHAESVVTSAGGEVDFDGDVGEFFYEFDISYWEE